MTLLKVHITLNTKKYCLFKKKPNVINVLYMLSIYIYIYMFELVDAYLVYSRKSRC